MTQLVTQEIDEIVVDEWELTSNPIPETFMDDSGFVSGLFKLRDRRIIELVLSEDGVHIKGQNYVGVSVLPSSRGKVRIVIRPKVPTRSLVQVMLYSVENFSLKEIRDLVTEIGIEDELQVVDVLALALVKRFIMKLSEAVVWGFMVTEEYEKIVSSVIQGRMLTSETVNTISNLGAPVVVSMIRKYTRNNRINAMTKLVCQRMLDKRWRLVVKRRDLRIINTALLELWNVNEAQLPPFESLNMYQLVRALPFNRNYLAQLAWLSYAFLTYIKLGKYVRFPSIYVNMDQIFERFVRRLFIDATRPLGLRARKAGKRDEVCLTDVPKIHGLRPDILVFKEGKVMLVADVKYTLETPEQDKDAHYQIFAYMMRYKTDHCALIFPETDRKKPIKTFEIKINRQRKYLHLLNISLENIETTEEIMQKFVNNLFEQKQNLKTYSRG